MAPRIYWPTEKWYTGGPSVSRIYNVWLDSPYEWNSYRPAVPVAESSEDGR